MNVYADASVLVALISEDPSADRAHALLQEVRGPVIVSDFAAAETASTLGRKVRTGDLAEADARSAMADLDVRVASAAASVEIAPSDVADAIRMLRRFDLSLRAPDAIHIAAAKRLGATLATFDRRMAADARRLELRTIGS